MATTTFLLRTKFSLGAPVSPKGVNFSALPRGTPNGWSCFFSKPQMTLNPRKSSNMTEAPTAPPLLAQLSLDLKTGQIYA